MAAPATLPTGPGTYVLVLEAPDGGEVQVGALGALTLDGGAYLYVGSAFGPGGLRARVGRHLRGGGTVHWHIDHLLRAAPVAEVWYTADPPRREEAWVEAIRAAPGSANPLRGFGAGDCGCEGHLFQLEARPGLDAFRGWLADAGADGCDVRAIRGSSAPEKGPA